MCQLITNLHSVESYDTRKKQSIVYKLRLTLYVPDKLGAILFYFIHMHKPSSVASKASIKAVII